MWSGAMSAIDNGKAQPQTCQLSIQMQLQY